MFRKKKYFPSGSLSKLAIRKVMRNPLAVVSLCFILLLIIISILGYVITPDSTPYANQQHLELNTKKPGFSVMMLKVPAKIQHSVKQNFFIKMLFGENLSYDLVPVHSYYFKHDTLFYESYTGMQPNNGDINVIAIQNLFSSSEDENFTISPNQSELTPEQKEKIISTYFEHKTFLLGSDRFGRDVLSQLLIGTRVSLSVGFISVAISLLIGITLGAIAGYFRGWIDQLIMWFINVVWSIPTLLLVIAITFVLGKGFWQVFIAVGLTMWVEVARVVRGQILAVREKEFVEAGVALGFSNTRIIFRHILPNVLSPVIVISAANFASAILIEAGLSFLGIGVQPPVPSWGTMIKEHYGYIILDYAYLAIIPGIAIMLTVLAFMLIGNALRDALDVKIVSK
jgi:peptide/nickel transport system permease protein